MTTLKEDTLKQEKPCIFDHEDKLLLITRMQSDGTSYDYCQGCGWVDVKDLITKHEVEARLNERELVFKENSWEGRFGKIDFSASPFSANFYAMHKKRLSELQKKGQS